MTSKVDRVHKGYGHSDLCDTERNYIVSCLITIIDLHMDHKNYLNLLPEKKNKLTKLSNL